MEKQKTTKRRRCWSLKAAHLATRCKQDVTLKDGSQAQCMRSRTVGDYCYQHAPKEPTS